MLDIVKSQAIKITNQNSKNFLHKFHTLATMFLLYTKIHIACHSLECLEANKQHDNRTKDLIVFPSDDSENMGAKSTEFGLRSADYDHESGDVTVNLTLMVGSGR